MGIASLKPYNLIGVQNKLDRLYGRKLSLRQSFSFASRYLKDKGKESVYEKPYLDLSRPQMHQAPPTPDWYVPPVPIGQYPPNDPKYHIYIFAPGIVDMFIHGPAECEGDPVPGSANVSLQAQHSKFGRNVWKFTSSDERVRVINESYFPVWSEASVDFDVEFDYVSEETEVTMCASVFFSGDLVRKIGVPGETTVTGQSVPMPGWEGTPQEAPTVPVLPLEIWTDYVYPLECTELILEPCCDIATEIAWDWITSAAVINRDSSGTIAILDPTGEGGDYHWSVSGTGWSLTSAVTSGLSNTLNADGTACGTAEITVVGCNGNGDITVTGYVRSNIGGWTTCGEEVEIGVDYEEAGSGYNDTTGCVWGKYAVFGSNIIFPDCNCWYCKDDCDRQENCTQTRDCDGNLISIANIYANDSNCLNWNPSNPTCCIAVVSTNCDSADASIKFWEC